MFNLDSTLQEAKERLAVWLDMHPNQYPDEVTLYSIAVGVQEPCQGLTKYLVRRLTRWAETRRLSPADSAFLLRRYD